MKRTVFLGLISLLLIPLVAIGCSASAATDQPGQTTMPALNGGEEARTIELTTDDFAANNHVEQDVTIKQPGSLIITLGANPTTGFQWAENAVIAGNVMTQISHTYVEPQADSGIVGAPGKDVWVFDSIEPGTATLTFEYSRPWEGGEQAEWTLTVHITVE